MEYILILWFVGATSSVAEDKAAIHSVSFRDAGSCIYALKTLRRYEAPVTGACVPFSKKP